MKKFGLVLASIILFGSNNSFAIASEPTNPECTITGTSASETLFGTPEDDIICGMGGNDIIYALDGNDVILGGDGNDYEDGGPGTDELYGDSGTDNLFGNTGADEIYGGTGNDGLNGGAGTDLLRGEDGVDTCVDFAKDNYLKSDCFYDKALPTIQSISFGTNNPHINSMGDGAYVDLFVKASDLGAGLLSFEVTFAPTSRLRQGALIGADGALRDASVKCQDLVQDSVPIELLSSYPNTNCLYSGTPNNGVFKVSVHLPGNLPKAEYSIWEFRYEDQAHNARTLQWYDVAKQKLQVRFTQTGAADHAAPKLLGGGIIGTRIVRDGTEHVKARIAFKDAGGSAIKRFWMSYDLPEIGYALDPGFEQWVNLPDSVQSCDYFHGDFDPCLYSGTESSGVLEFYLDVDPNWHDLKFLWKAQKLVPKFYSIEDVLGNQYQGTLPKALAKALTYYKGFSGRPPVDDKDVTPPTLVDFVVDKTHIDTGVSAQTITVNVTLKDTGAGLNRYNGNVNLDMDAPGAVCMRAQMATGSNLQATYTFKCTIDAHVAAGTYNFFFNASDMSLRANTLFLQPNQILSQGKVVKITNG